MSAETLASFVILGRVDDRPTDVCGAWIDSATDDIATSVHGLMSRSHAETGG